MPDIHQDEYTIDGLSHLLGISREVITHEISTGDLHAERVGTHTICISREAVLDWLQRRGVGI
jgi:excisionase family DNA binding protein